MNLQRLEANEEALTPNGPAYPGRYTVSDGPKTWIVFGIVLLVVVFAAFALTVRPAGTRSGAPSSMAHPKQGR